MSTADRVIEDHGHNATRTARPARHWTFPSAACHVPCLALPDAADWQTPIVPPDVIVIAYYHEKGGGGRDIGNRNVLFF